jgi:hypothetical protein
MSSFGKKLKSLHIFVGPKNIKKSLRVDGKKKGTGRRDWRNIVLVYDKNKRLRQSLRLESALFY